MANQEKQSLAQQEPSGMHTWGQVLANGLWGLTLLMVLAFFWQSISEVLAK